MNVTVAMSLLVGAIAVTVVAATWFATRGDKRYEIAAAERNEYRARAERLEKEAAAAKRQLVVIEREVLERERTPEGLLLALQARLDWQLREVAELRRSIDVHSGELPDLRVRDDSSAPRRRLTDGG